MVPGARVLDVGCGPGRHALALAKRGAVVTGVDISEEFIRLAREGAATAAIEVAFECGDARGLAFDEEFDAVICLCQGAFGLPEQADDDHAVFDGLVRALKPGGRLALSAFSAYFALRFLEPHDTFDAATGVNHELATLKDPTGQERQFDLWTSCWTPRELRYLAGRGGLEGVRIGSVAPGRYGADPPNTDSPEFLLTAVKPLPGSEEAKKGRER